MSALLENIGLIILKIIAYIGQISIGLISNEIFQIMVAVIIFCILINLLINLINNIRANKREYKEWKNEYAEDDIRIREAEEEDLDDRML